MSHARRATKLMIAVVAIAMTGAAEEPEEPNGRLGRWTVLVPERSVSEFEEGYRRHLDWHRDQGDQWTWYGWTVVTGDRYGTFIDATLGHCPDDFDAPVRPAEDAADNRRNVLPNVVRGETYIVRSRDDLSNPIGTLESVPFLQLFDYQIAATGYADFVELVRDTRSKDTEARYDVLEVISGGELPRFLLIVPASKLSSLDPLDGLLPSEIVARDVDQSRVRQLARAVRSVRSELLRYRPDLSFIPPVAPGAVDEPCGR